GTLKKLNRQELEGVIAHEMSHIKNYDIRMMMYAAVMVGAIAIMAHMMLRIGFMGGRSNNKGKGGGIIMVLGLVAMIIAPIVAKMVQLAISRKREYLADASGALLTRYPAGLAGALEKIQKDTSTMESVSEAVAPLFISNPLRNRFLGNLFSSHPPLEDRIAILRKM
ncbi:MAG: M48 family metalloprotease, partial [Candidatus Micrarchaeota archaeon]